MREILFRVKTLSGKWFQGDLKHYFGKCTITKYEEFWVIPETFRLYTGLTDKNGKKIFEGDVVRFPLKYIDKVAIFTGEVKWSCYGLYIVTNEPNGMAARQLGTTAHKSEIIGNIHDNPELLKGE